MSDVWDKLWWQGTIDTITDRDILYMVDEIKLEYTLPLLRTLAGEISTLEVGSGSGRLSCFLASKDYQTTCLDYSRNALRVASNNYRLMENDGNFILADAESLPFKNGSFDAVLSTGLLEHFPDPQVVVSEMARILKTDGYFISDIVPRKLFSLYRSLYRIIHIIKIITSINFYKKAGQQEAIYEGSPSKRDIKNWLEYAGLQNINIFAAGVVPPPLVIPRFIPFRKHIIFVYHALVYRFKRFFKLFDNTIIAEFFGLYYFAHARKPDSEDDMTSNL